MSCTAIRRVSARKSSAVGINATIRLLTYKFLGIVTGLLAIALCAILKLEEGPSSNTFVNHRSDGDTRERKKLSQEIHLILDETFLSSRAAFDHRCL